MKTVAPTPHVRRVGFVITIASLVAVGYATLLPATAADTSSHFCLICGSLGGVNAILNVFLFLPLGIGLSLSGFRGRHAALAMCAMSVLIETAQLLMIPGRYSTIGDVLSNTLGGLLGFAMGRYASTLLRPSPRIALALSMIWAAVWLAIQSISAFGFAPAIPMSEYYGQIARRLGNYEQFHGRVLRASIADVVVPDTRFKDNPHVRELLLHGAIVTTTFVPAGPTHGVAPIVRVADSRQREIMLLGQDAEAVVFRVRTRADMLRLRPPIFTLPNLFTVTSHGDSGLTTDTLTVCATHSAREVWVSEQAVGASYVRRIPISASLGWTMLLPFQWYVEGTRVELVLSAMWIAALLLPLGYWGAGLIRSWRTGEAARVRMIAVPAVLALLFVGLAGMPLALGLSAAPGSDWVGAFTGLLIGGALALRFAGAGVGVLHRH